jgi:hypothetical protein
VIMGCDFHMCTLTFTPIENNKCVVIVIRTVINTQGVNQAFVQVRI